jgi:hypothetical protein
MLPSACARGGASIRAGSVARTAPRLLCPGAAGGRPAGPPLLRLRSPREVAAKQPDTRIDGPLTRAVAILRNAVLGQLPQLDWVRVA